MKELQPVQPISVDNIKTKIYEFRGQKVMLDFDLALLYQVETKRLKEAVKRNIDRFPEDAMFVLTEDEFLSIFYNYASKRYASERNLEKLQFGINNLTQKPKGVLYCLTRIQCHLSQQNHLLQ